MVDITKQSLFPNGNGLWMNRLTMEAAGVSVYSHGVTGPGHCHYM